jgi:hypothetical protein
MLEELKQYIEVGEYLIKEVENSDLIPNIARLYRKLFDELIEQNFTHKEALEIITSLKIGK